MLSSAGRAGGFSLVEVVVALVILSTAVLGLSSAAGRLTTAAAEAELRALALHSVDDRLARIRLDPRYAGLDTLYAGVDRNLFGLPDVSRTTTVQHVVRRTPTALDYKRITVTVSGHPLTQSITRQIIIAAP